MESSVDVFEEYVNEIVGKQEERIIQTSDTIITFNKELTLIIDPTGGIYGDEIHATGVYSRTGEIPTGKPVTLYIDSRKYANSSCTTTGEYDIPVTIQQMYAGTHLAYTRAGDVFSPIVPISVAATDGILTLNVSVQGNTVFSSGRLSTEGIGLSDVPVTIYFSGPDTENVTIVQTDRTGVYSCATELASGEYTIQSVFSDPTFPVRECRSEECSVSVNQSNLYLSIILFMICGGGAGYLILRRRQSDREQEPSFHETDETDKPAEFLSGDSMADMRDEGGIKTQLADAAVIQDFRSRYILQKTLLSPADAARILGEGFHVAIESYTGQECRPSETVREQALKLDEKCRKQASVFVAMYEAMVYGKDYQKGDELLSA